MNQKIAAVLRRLDAASNLERSHKLDIAPEDRMLAITPDTGLFYNILLRSMGAARILEIGLSTGYSTAWFAEALLDNPVSDNAKITTIEKNPSKIRRAKENLSEAGVIDLIDIREGAAIDVLDTLHGEQFDFVFIDADKENIIKYFDAAFPMLAPCGIIGADNMLYPEKYQKQMEKYHLYAAAQKGAKTTTINVGNGQEITIKV